MVRKPFGFGAGYKPPKQPKPPPPPRNYEMEGRLCEAIGKRVLVELRYKDDVAFRRIEPTAVYPTGTGNVCLSCTQLSNPNEFGDENGPHNFTVGKISALRLTDDKFQPDPRFDRFDSKYRHGIICSV